MGFSLSGNRGSGLGADFAEALHENLHKLFSDFGKEQITKGSHLEKLCLIREGVGKDNISDFTVNLIKRYLCSFTQAFAQKHIKQELRKVVQVPKVIFNYDTETWETEQFDLPWAEGDYVLLTPKDILTRDDTWINKADLIEGFEEIPAAILDEELRGQVNNYFKKVLIRDLDKDPTKAQYADAARKTILEFPSLIDHYIRYKEQHGDDAESVSSKKVKFSEYFFVAQIKALQKDLNSESGFYKIGGTSHEEAHQRLAFLKDVIENKGGHRIFYVDDVPIRREIDLHIMYRLVWLGTPSDISREVDDGRGPADFKASRGAKDKTIVEFKLAKNTQLERNLGKQVEAYQKASDAKNAIKAIVHFSEEERQRVVSILKRLKIEGHPDIVLIDASPKESLNKSPE